MFKWWRIYQEENPGDNAGAGGGAATTTTEQPAAEAGDGATAAPAAGPDGKPIDAMAAAIDAALGYEPGKDGKVDTDAAPAKGAPAGETPEAKIEREKKDSEAKAAKERDEKAAAGDQEAIKAKQAAEAKAAAEAKKPKDLKALELTEADKKVMKAQTAARYNEVLGIAKTEREQRLAAESQLKVATDARDGILTVLKETQTTDEDLVQLLEFNRLTKTGRPEDLKAALGVIDAQRGFLLKALGKKGDGHDPLADPANADLKQDVDDQKITEQRALEIAESRREKALLKAGEDRAAKGRQSQEQINKAHEKGLAEVEAWSTGIARTDIDFKAKETILLPKIDQIVATYPPHLWLPTIKQAYELIVVPKAPAAPAKGDQPLRPSGAKPGGPAPTSMGEAIDQALGYGSK